MNSRSRLAWTKAGADFFASSRHPGEGILTTSGTGDIAGIFCRARIPLRKVLHIGNGPAWLATTSRPDLIHDELWAIAQAGDFLSNAMHRQRGPVYQLIEQIEVKGAPTLEIYRRSGK